MKTIVIEKQDGVYKKTETRKVYCLYINGTHEQCYETDEEAFRAFEYRQRSGYNRDADISEEVYEKGCDCGFTLGDE